MGKGRSTKGRGALTGTRGRMIVRTCAYGGIPKRRQLQVYWRTLRRLTAFLAGYGHDATPAALPRMATWSYIVNAAFRV